MATEERETFKVQIEDLQHERSDQRCQLREEQDHLVEIDTRLLGVIVKRYLPTARKVIFKAERKQHHWTESWVALSLILDADHQPLSWKGVLPAQALQLIEQIQFDLTDCYAIPRDEVEITLTI